MDTVIGGIVATLLASAVLGAFWYRDYQESREMARALQLHSDRLEKLDDLQTASFEQLRIMSSETDPVALGNSLAKVRSGLAGALANLHADIPSDDPLYSRLLEIER